MTLKGALAMRLPYWGFSTAGSDLHTISVMIRHCGIDPLLPDLKSTTQIILTAPVADLDVLK